MLWLVSGAERLADDARLAAEEAPREAADELRARVLPEEDRPRVPPEEDWPRADCPRVLPEEDWPREDCPRVLPEEDPPEDLDPELERLAVERLAVERVDPDEDRVRLLGPLLVAISLHLFVSSPSCYPPVSDR